MTNRAHIGISPPPGRRPSDREGDVLLRSAALEGDRFLKWPEWFDSCLSAAGLQNEESYATHSLHVHKPPAFLVRPLIGKDRRNPAMIRTDFRASRAGEVRSVPLAMLSTISR